MSYSVNTSDVEEKTLSDFRHNRSSSNLVAKNMGTSKIADVLWANKQQQQQRQHDDDTDSEISDSGNFLAKGRNEECVKDLKMRMMFYAFRRLLVDSIARVVDGTGGADLREDELQGLLQFDKDRHRDSVQVLESRGLSGGVQEGISQGYRGQIL